MPDMPQEPYNVMWRLVAGEGYMITNDTVTVEVIDTESPEAWNEIESVE